MVRLGVDDISRLIPHRAPFLFVRSAEIDDGNGIRALCRWDADSPLLRGHFPGLPIVPGVLLVEAAAQVAGIHIAYCRSSMDSGHQVLGMLTTIRKATVHRPVSPGVDVEFQVALEEPVGTMYGVRAEAFSVLDGQRVFRGELVLALAGQPLPPAEA